MSRAEDPTDRRRKRLALTNTAVGLINELDQTGLSPLLDAMGGLETDELDALLALLGKLKRLAEARNAAGQPEKSGTA